MNNHLKGCNRLQRRLKLFTILVLGLIQTLVIEAQEAIPASGSIASGSGGSVSYTVGQVFFNTVTGINGSVAEGVQQPYEISVVVGIEEADGINLICRAYPNPVTDHLILEVEFHDNEKYFFQLYDMLGKLLVSKNVMDIRTTIPMQNLPPATYFLNVTVNQKVVKTFKIIKNH
jgi:hypothetical protein